MRVGIHSGIYKEEDATLNDVTHRVAYGGQPLAIAKATSDCAAGGQVRHICVIMCMRSLPSYQLQLMSLWVSCVPQTHWRRKVAMHCCLCSFCCVGVP